MARKGPPGFYDLTLDEDDDDDKDHQSKPFKIKQEVPTLQQPLKAFPPQSRPQVAALSPSFATALSRRPEPQTNGREHLNSFPVPPAKRQKIKEAGLPDLKSDRFNAYLEEHLCPTINQTIARKASQYEGRWAEKLHYTVLCRVTDLAFENEWVRNNYKLSPAFEAALHRRIARLVVELQRTPVSDETPVRGASWSNTYLWQELLQSPQQQLVEQPPVLPSIEPDDETRRRPRAEQAAAASNEQRDADTATQGLYTAPDQSRVTRRGRTQKGHPKARQPTYKASSKLRQSRKAVDGHNHSSTSSSPNQWFSLSERPYLPYKLREAIIKQEHHLKLPDAELRQPLPVHVDLSDEEIIYILYVTTEVLAIRSRNTGNHIRDLRRLLSKANKLNGSERLPDVFEAHENGYEGFIPPPTSLLTRNTEDLSAIIEDVYHRNFPLTAHIYTIRRDEPKNGKIRGDDIALLLQTREVRGNRPFCARQHVNFTTGFKSSHEDTLEPAIEWVNCAGDIMTLSWLSDEHFLCGTTTHSDAHNQQYNKPGNLLLGSADGTLRAYPDHRVVRPVVSHGINASDSMVESQDPWMFTSVVDSDYDPRRELAFTASFDKTVKIWRVSNGTMKATGTWEHSGRVNFVLVSKHPSGMVATAADVITDAVRVYHTDSVHSDQAFDSYSCTKIHDEVYVPSEKWGYCPAAIRWGLAPTVQHLLLVGYSPRSLTGDDRDIPEDKYSTGELCLWDTVRRTGIKINSLATQNVFEVAWHPSRNSFAVATSKALSIERNDNNVKTQIRIFELNSDGQYGAIKTLDCPAIDINELAIQPNSLAYSYVAAGCTDGNVYVWDTAGSDLAMCVLKHGDPVEEFIGEKELEDVGVKFIAWGTTADRLYTGSSDGVVKVWNIRHGKSNHVRDLIEVPGPITAGAFSPDYSKLVVGDGSGRVYLLRLTVAMAEDEMDTSAGLFRPRLEGLQRAIRRPWPLIPHPEVPPPPSDLDGPTPELSLGVGQERARAFVQRGEIVIHPHPCVGAVQGPRYNDTMFFCTEAHFEEDVRQPLLASDEAKQQENNRVSKALQASKPPKVSFEHHQRVVQLHQSNDRLERFPASTWNALIAERADCEPQYELHFQGGYRYSDDSDDDSGDEYVNIWPDL